MYKSLHVKNWLLLSDLNETLIFSIDLWKILRYQISWKSVQWSWVVPCGRTDRDTMKLIVALTIMRMCLIMKVIMCVCVCVRAYFWNKNYSQSTPGCHARQVGRHMAVWFWNLLVFKIQDAGGKKFFLHSGMYLLNYNQSHPRGVYLKYGNNLKEWTCISISI